MEKDEEKKKKRKKIIKLVLVILGSILLIPAFFAMVMDYSNQNDVVELVAWRILIMMAVGLILLSIALYWHLKEEDNLIESKNIGERR